MRSRAGARTAAADSALAAEHQTDHTEQTGHAEQTIEAGATHLRQLRPATGGNSHWDAKLGVYVLDNQTNTFYRQRTYYRWDNGWSRSISLTGRGKRRISTVYRVGWADNSGSEWKRRSEDRRFAFWHL